MTGSAKFDPDRFSRAAIRQELARNATPYPIPARITAALDMRGLYGPKVDHACGVEEPAVDEWEAGDRIPTREQVVLLADLTSFPVAYFYMPMRAEPLTGFWVCGRHCRPGPADPPAEAGCTCGWPGVVRPASSDAVLMGRRPPTLAAASLRRGPAPTSPVPVDRCHWVRCTDQPDGVDPWVLIPGCSTAWDHPDGVCSCDTVAYRYALQVQQRRDVDETVTALRARLKAWQVAAQAARAALLGDPPPEPARGSHLWPQDLASAARRATATRTTGRGASG